MRAPVCNILCLTLCFSLLGCGSGTAPDTPELAPVTGTVTLDGQPLTNVTVTFESPNGQTSFGRTDDSGHYELQYRDELKGAGLGENTVRIETPLEAPPAPGYKDPIPAKYNTQTTLVEQIQPGENTIDFALESK